MTGLLVALDFHDVADAVSMAKRVEPHVSGFKVGLELLLGADSTALEQIVGLGRPVFADAKLHDIPATVERAAFQLAKRGARWVTVHAGGGVSMLQAAVKGLERGSDGTAGALAVTVLTSLEEADLVEVGVAGGTVEQVMRLASLAAKSGAEGVVCAVPEVAAVRQATDQLLTVTPGIRARDDDPHDQKRPATPAAARSAGSDFVVVGRSITGAADPQSAAAEIAAELNGHSDGANPDSRG